MNLSLLLLAGGTGTRFGSATPKQFLPLNGKPVALHSFDLFSSWPEVDALIVVVSAPFRSLFSSHKPLLFANPGERRQDSVANGLSLVTTEWVAIHDAARPFLDRSDFLRLLEGRSRSPAVALGHPVTSTIKRCNREGRVVETLDRSTLWDMQTPQLIRTDLLRKAYTAPSFATDDLSLLEQIGVPCHVIPASPRNFKITHPQDLFIAEALCRAGN